MLSPVLSIVSAFVDTGADAHGAPAAVVVETAVTASEVTEVFAPTPICGAGGGTTLAVGIGVDSSAAAVSVADGEDSIIMRGT